MACFLVAFMLLISGVGLMFAVSAITESRSRYWAACQAVATQVKGRVASGGLWGTPEVLFPYGEGRGSVFYRRESGQWMTWLRLQPLELNHRFELREKSNSHIAAPQGMRSVSLDNSALSQRLDVWASDEERFRKVVEPCLRHLQPLITASNRSGFRVALQGQVLMLGVPQRVYDWRMLLEIIRFGCQFYDQLQLANDQAIQFVEEVEATLLVDVTCPICGDPIERDLVYCSSCKTPHHRECWEYNTRCATFACGATNYLFPQVARIVATSDRPLTERKSTDADGVSEPKATPVADPRQN